MQDGRCPTAAKNPPDFFPPAAEKRARAGVAKGIAGGGAPGDRERPVAGTMAVAGEDAAVPAVGKRFVGSPDGPADETDAARVALPLPRTPRRAAWVNKKRGRRRMMIWHGREKVRRS